MSDILFDVDSVESDLRELLRFDETQAHRLFTHERETLSKEER